MRGSDLILPAAKRWGGGPPEGWWKGNWRGLPYYPSTMLRMVPLPIFDGEDD
ncbi:MAG: hypothetical protein QOJ27_2185 [Sphingomonadales bacterium]|nr:hypothetical protein [Sphingomonadales bacterium]